MEPDWTRQIGEELKRTGVDWMECHRFGIDWTELV